MKKSIISKLFGCLIAGVSVFIGFWVSVTVIFVFILPYHNICETERKALSGDPESERVLAYNYQFAMRSPECSWGRFAPNKRKAMQWLETAAKGRDPDAILHLPELYEHDFPGERSSDLVKWYVAAAKQGNDGATKRLTDIYRFGQLNQPRDSKAASLWEMFRAKQLRDEALQSLENSAGAEGGVGKGGGIGGGSAKAAQALKDIYTYGKLGKSRDPKAVAYWEIVRWQDTVANISDEQKAINAVGNGETVKVLKEAATLGDVEAAKELVDIYKYGQLDQPRNAKEAARWAAVRNAGNKLEPQEQAAL